MRRIIVSWRELSHEIPTISTTDESDRQLDLCDLGPNNIAVTLWSRFSDVRTHRRVYLDGTGFGLAIYLFGLGGSSSSVDSTHGSANLCRVVSERLFTRLRYIHRVRRKTERVHRNYRDDIIYSVLWLELRNSGNNMQEQVRTKLRVRRIGSSTCTEALIPKIVGEWGNALCHQRAGGTSQSLFE